MKEQHQLDLNLPPKKAGKNTLEKKYHDILGAIRETPARTTEVITDHLDN